MRKLVLGVGSICVAGVLGLAGSMAVGPTATKKELKIKPAAAANSSTRASQVPSTITETASRNTISSAEPRNYGKFPLAFEPNQGQAKEPAKFLARGNGYALWLDPTGIQLAVRRSTHDKTKGQPANRNNRPIVEQVHTSSHSEFRNASEVAGMLRMELVGANPALGFTALEKLPGESNYFIGNDPAQWRTNVPNYRKIAEHGVYDGVDLVYYGTQRQLEYDFVVAPGADPGVIRLAIRGARKLRTDSRGDLVIGVSGGELRLERPVAYQATESGKHLVASNYVVENSRTVTFQVGEYDRDRTLVIDPILSYSTYLGGSNIDGANAIAVAPDKTAFITGGTFSLDFPTAHPLQPNHGGPDDAIRDAIVSKLSADGSTLLYSTYLGGTSDDVGNGIAVDSFGNAYVTGTTDSHDFPVPSIISSFNRLCGGDGQCGTSWNSQGLSVSAAFVVKLNPQGSALLYSSYLGFYENVFGLAIAVDANQLAYVTGRVGPNLVPTVVILPPKLPPPPFPITTATAAQPAFGGGDFDAFVTVISSSGDSIVYSTYLGGSHEDDGNGIAVDNATNAYVTGLSYSPDFPVTASALQSTNGGNGDAFFAKVNTTGGPLAYSTLLGGSNLDQGNGVAVDSTGNAYITGFVGAGALPFGSSSLCGNGVTTGLCGGTADAFVAKIDPTKTGLASLLFFTYLGGSGADSGNGIAVDTAGNAYVTGSTVSTDFPTTAAVFQRQYGGGNADAFVTRIDPTGSTLLYSSFLGGTNTDIGYGIAVDSTSPTTGASYVAGQTCSLDFPSANPLQAAPGGNCDAFVSKVEILDGLELNPSGLVFNGQSLGTTSQAQVVKVTNGDATETISPFAITGDDPGDFAETTTCGSPLAPGTQCTISVTFTPQVAGIRKAQINVPCPTCGASGITYILNLTGTTSTLTLSASNLAFGNQHVGVASSPSTITATNNGTVAITFSSITASGDFAETDNCKVPLQPGTNCVINVTYTPTTAGNSVGALTLTDNAPGSPQVILLTGTGFGEQSDFAVSIQPPNASVPAGKPAQFTLTVTSFGGFSQPVTLACAGLPKSASCESSANPVTPSATGASVTILITTGSRTLLPPNGQIRVEPPSAIPFLGPIWVLLLISVLVFAYSMRRRPKLAAISALVVVMAMTLLSVACSGGSQAGAAPGTPAGTYQITIVGTSGALQHAAPVTLQVK